MPTPTDPPPPEPRDPEPDLEARGVEREVTELEAAAHDRALLAAIIESSQDAIVSKDLDGIITSWNGAAERLFGYTAEEAIGRSITMLIPADREVEEPGILDRIRRGEAVEHFETVRRRKDGTVVDISLTVSPIRDAQGRVVGASKIARDITERRRAEERLRRAEERYRVLAELMPLGVYACSAPDGRITYYNRHAAALWGRAPEIGEPHARFARSFKLYEPDGRRLSPEEGLVCLALREGVAFRNREVVLERDDGTRLVLLAHVEPIRNAAQDETGVIAAFHDVTAMKHAEQALREADRRKDEFLATLAHELRNPLAPILVGLEVMRLSRGEPATLEQAIGTIERQTQQLVRLVDDLLDVSRITRGKMDLRRTRVAVSDVVRSAVETSRPAIDQARHALEVDLPDAALYLDADPSRIAQVISNLLNNAARYTPPGGHIRLAAEREGGEVAIAVEDTGVGIPEELQEHVFEMFAQIERHHEQGSTGLGIGLTLARSLVEMHGGTIRAHTPPTGGSTFTVRLPLSSAPAARPAGPPADEPAVHGPRRVLVVDDNPDAVHTLSTMLRMLGHEVRTAEDGRRALEVASDFHPHVVLMDLGMPGMTGYEAARRMRAQPWGAGVALIALSGWGQEEHKRRTREAGFDHHVVKPVEPADLRRLLAG